MFTGIVEETGVIRAVQRGAKSAVLTVEAKKVLEDVHVGDSIATNGVCLTVTLGSLTPGSRVNLERAMAANGRFGGHIVSGHIDGTGTVVSVRRDDIAVWYTIRTTPQLMRYIVEKGSIAIDGISLTVAAVETDRFSVSIIPHTVQETTLGEKRPGATVNLENDIIGKYVEKLMQKDGGMTPEFLAQNGF